MQIIKSKLNINLPIKISWKSPDTLFCHLWCLFRSQKCLSIDVVVKSLEPFPHVPQKHQVFPICQSHSAVCPFLLSPIYFNLQKPSLVICGPQVSNYIFLDLIFSHVQIRKIVVLVSKNSPQTFSFPLCLFSLPRGAELSPVSMSCLCAPRVTGHSRCFNTALQVIADFLLSPYSVSRLRLGTISYTSLNPTYLVEGLVFHKCLLNSIQKIINLLSNHKYFAFSNFKCKSDLCLFLGCVNKVECNGNFVLHLIFIFLGLFYIHYPKLL